MYKDPAFLSPSLSPGRAQAPLALDRHQAGAAGAGGLKTRVVAESGDGDAGAFSRVKDSLPGGGGDGLPIEGEGEREAHDGRSEGVGWSP